MRTIARTASVGTGYFGLKLGKGLLNGVFLGSLVPHIAYGVVLGLLLERYVRHKGSILGLVREALDTERRSKCGSRPVPVRGQ